MPLYWPLCYNGCETWTEYRRSIERLDQFHLCCLRKTAGIKWQDRVTNTEVLQICGTTGIEGLKRSCSKVNFVGSVTLCVCQSTVSQNKFSLDNWHRASGRSVDPPVVIKILWGSTWSNVKLTGSLTSATSDRSSWRTLCHNAVTEFEDTRVAALTHKRAVRKFDAQPSIV